MSEPECEKAALAPRKNLQDNDPDPRGNDFVHFAVALR
jgi:hypothetical protein